MGARPQGLVKQSGGSVRVYSNPLVEKNRSPPAGNEGNSRVLFGASREEAPEEEIASRATRLPGFFGTLVSKAGRKSGYPKKGRGTSDGFDLWSGLAVKDKRTLGRRSQVEVRLLFGGNSRMESDA
jgi:hypothetical protein